MMRVPASIRSCSGHTCMTGGGATRCQPATACRLRHKRVRDAAEAHRHLPEQFLIVIFLCPTSPLPDNRIFEAGRIRHPEPPKSSR